MSVLVCSRTHPLVVSARCRQIAAAVFVALLRLPASASEPVAPNQMKGEVKPLSAIRFEQDEDVKCLLSALETGDSVKGPSTFILKAPPGCVVPWHFHSAREQAIVIRGDVMMEMDAHSPITLGAGGFAVMQSKTAHQFSCVGRTACLLTVAFDRPYDIFWVKR
jgi:quercetin dioxygenase-like cupin family protein